MSAVGDIAALGNMALGFVPLARRTIAGPLSKRKKAKRNPFGRIGGDIPGFPNTQGPLNLGQNPMDFFGRLNTNMREPGGGLSFLGVGSPRAPQLAERLNAQVQQWRAGGEFNRGEWNSIAKELYGMGGESKKLAEEMLQMNPLGGISSDTSREEVVDAYIQDRGESQRILDENFDRRKQATDKYSQAVENTENRFSNLMSRMNSGFADITRETNVARKAIDQARGNAAAVHRSSMMGAEARRTRAMEDFDLEVSDMMGSVRASMKNNFKQEMNRFLSEQGALPGTTVEDRASKIHEMNFRQAGEIGATLSGFSAQVAQIRSSLGQAYDDMTSRLDQFLTGARVGLEGNLASLHTTLTTSALRERNNLRSVVAQAELEGDQLVLMGRQGEAELQFALSRQYAPIGDIIGLSFGLFEEEVLQDEAEFYQALGSARSALDSFMQYQQNQDSLDAAAKQAEPGGLFGLGGRAAGPGAALGATISLLDPTGVSAATALAGAGIGAGIGGGIGSAF